MLFLITKANIFNFFQDFYGFAGKEFDRLPGAAV